MDWWSFAPNRPLRLPPHHLLPWLPTHRFTTRVVWVVCTVPASHGLAYVVVDGGAGCCVRRGPEGVVCTACVAPCRLRPPTATSNSVCADRRRIRIRRLFPAPRCTVPCLVAERSSTRLLLGVCGASSLTRPLISLSPSTTNNHPQPFHLKTSATPALSKTDSTTYIGAATALSNVEKQAWHLILIRRLQWRCLKLFKARALQTM